jgi:hypothetical protein
LILRIDNLFWGNQLLHLQWRRLAPVVVQRRSLLLKSSLENYSGHVNIHSGPDRILHPFPPGISIHIAPESLFTSLRNDYSHAPESAADEQNIIALYA